MAQDWNLIHLALNFGGVLSYLLWTCLHAQAGLLNLLIFPVSIANLLALFQRQHCRSQTMELLRVNGLSRHKCHQIVTKSTKTCLSCKLIL